MENYDISSNEIKDQLYSRQIATIGIESMKKISELKILIIGLRGLGVEICKNIILQGPSKLSIFDNIITEKKDLCCNFYLEEKDVGIKRRDTSIINKLMELNKYVNVECLSQYNSIEELEELIEEYNIVVITEIVKREMLIKINEKCRQKNIKFIFGVTLCLTGYIFSDFGKEHLIFNKNDKEPNIYTIKNIKNDINGLVELEEINEGINNVKSVVFRNIEGMTDLNDKEPIEIKIKDKYSFYIGDTSKYNKYIKGGLAIEKQIPIKKEFEGIEKRLNVPYNKKGDILRFISEEEEEKISSELLYMILIEIIEHFQKKGNSILYMNDNIYEYNNIIENIEKDINLKKDEYWIKNIGQINKEIIKNICLNCNKEIPCLTSFLGGIIAQEIIKTIGKYFPIDQWAIFDFSDNYNNYIKKNNDINITRYNYLYEIFGYENIINMQNKKIMIIGTGALGCELLKQFGLLGMKNCTAIDDDFIELSNLNRQFLFTDKDLGKQKVVVACDSVLKMNPELKNYVGISKKIEKETEIIFNEKFWKEQDIIFCALDSLSGRIYIDEKCLLYEKPWINGGMNGIKGKTEIFIPFKTCCLNDINYGEEEVNNEDMSCTLRYFPTKIEQCILWAKNLFFQYFIYYIYDFDKIFNNEKYFEIIEKFDEKNKSDLLRLSILYEYLKIYNSKNINNLKILAHKIFHLNFYVEIEEILKLYPEDLRKEDGSLFWKNKKIPRLIIINDNNINLYNNFLYNYIKILTSIFNIKVDNLKELLEINNKMEHNLIIDKKELMKKIIYLKKNVNKIQINKIEFQKDDINNGHMDFIHSCSCLRAIIYNIPMSDKYKTFKIAGNISPSTITINSSLGGLMSLELINFFCEENKIKKYTLDFDEGSGNYIEESPFGLYYKNSYYDNSSRCNIIALPKKFTLWDKIEIEGSKTVSEFIDYIKKEYNVEITLISANDIIIYEKKILKEIDKILEMKRGKKNDIFLNEKIEKVYNKKKGSINGEEESIFLQISGNFKDSRVLMPKFKYLM